MEVLEEVAREYNVEWLISGIITPNVKFYFSFSAILLPLWKGLPSKELVLSSGHGKA